MPTPLACLRSACEVLQYLPALEEAAWHVETAFPLATLEREQHLAAAVQIAEPFGVFGVLEMRPGVVVQPEEPVETRLRTGEAVSLDHRDHRFDMHPPQFLVPFELLLRVSEPVHEIEQAAVLLVPAIFSRVERDLYGLVDQRPVVEPHAEVHDEPHSFERVAGIDLPAFERVGELAVRCDVLDDQPQLPAVEDLHDLVDAIPDRRVEQRGVDHLLRFERHVAEDHRQGEILQVARARDGLAPRSLGVVAFFENPREGALGDFGILVAARGESRLREGHRGERVGKDVVGSHERPAFAREREVPVVILLPPK